jgi:threonine dehydrogenase-like Zn-dependent dehydrogenase
MRAALVKVRNHVRIVELPIRACAGQEVRLKIGYCGLCGSDFIDARCWARQWKRFGHEIVGTVVQAGPDAKGLSPGRRVVVALSAPCGQCDPCRQGQTRYCRNMLLAEQGGFAEYVNVDQRLAFPVPPEIPDALACFAEPITVVLDALEAACAPSGCALLVVGGGFLGQLALLVGRAGGLKVLGMMSRELRGGADRCLQIVGGEHFPWRMIGRKTLGAPSELTSRLAGLSGPLVVLHTAPACHIPKYLTALPFNVTLVNLGLSARRRENRLRLDAETLITRRVHLHAGFPVPCTHFPRALEILAAKREWFSAIETQVVGLSDLPTLIAGRRRPQAKVLIKP